MSNSKNLEKYFEISASEAWELLKKDENACIVDVRTVAEWSFVGVPDLSSIGRELHQISWRLYPSMELNEYFAKMLEHFVKDKISTRLIFLCRSGGRSLEAAQCALALGYKNCHNITEGFEGGIDKFGHRNNKNGWRHSDLPWVQT